MDKTTILMVLSAGYCLLGLNEIMSVVYVERPSKIHCHEIEATIDKIQKLWITDLTTHAEKIKKMNSQLSRKII
jgi:hypothetical protein